MPGKKKARKTAKIRDLRPAKDAKGGIWDKEHVLSLIKLGDGTLPKP
jgi:hypothetical protein